jgi:hypothetical protein
MLRREGRIRDIAPQKFVEKFKMVDNTEDSIQAGYSTIGSTVAVL